MFIPWTTSATGTIPLETNAAAVCSWEPPPAPMEAVKLPKGMNGRPHASRRGRA